MRLRTLWTALAVACLATSAAADLIVVDDDGGPGVDYTELADALAAASPGDIVRLHAGEYAPIVLTTPLTILGEPGAVVAGPSMIAALPSQAWVALADFTLAAPDVVDCNGTVVFDGMRLDDVSNRDPAREVVLDVRDSSDVRLHRTVVEATRPTASGAGRHGVRLTEADLELASSGVLAGHGAPGCGPLNTGGHGLVVATHSRAWVALTSLRGGDGGDAPAGCNARTSAGGHGILVFGGPQVPSRAYVSGIAANQIAGGDAGLEGSGAPGVGGDGARVLAWGELRHSSVALLPGCVDPQSSVACGPPHLGQPVANLGGAVDRPVLPDSSLEFIGTATLGSVATWRVHGVPGAATTLYLGLCPEQGFLKGSITPVQLAALRIFPLGPLSANGTNELSLPLGAGLPLGALLLGQVDYEIGPAFFSNSTPVVRR